MSRSLLVGRVVRGLVVLVASTVLSLPAWGQELTPDIYRSLTFRHIGPPGNKVLAVAGVPGDPDIIYAGTPSGGIFKTQDGGLHWRPIFDDQVVMSVGALAIAAADPNLVWAGTGDPFIRENVTVGNGLFKSTDAGQTWTHMGLDATGRIGRIVIHPNDPDLVYVAAMGRSHGPQPERGVFRTRDGGHTWEHVLFVDEHTGAIDLVLDPANPARLFAATWQLAMHPWGNEAGGQGSGLYRSEDGGATWTHLTGHGLPDPPLGRIGLAIAPSNPQRVYALIASDGRGNLWRSDDGGEEWALTSEDERLNRRAVYFSGIAVAPDDPDEVYFLAQSLYRSRDGGRTAERLHPPFPDQHNIWIDPLDAGRVIVANDRYVNISRNRGRSWYRTGLANAQIYRVATDRRVPYNVYGNRHDGPGFRGPSAHFATGGEGEDGTTRLISLDLWLWVGGTETGWSIPDPDNDDFVWASNQSSVQRIHMPSRTSRRVSPWPPRRPGGASAAPEEEPEFQLNHSVPIAVSPHRPRRIYAGSQYLHQTTDGGQTWTTISPDLTTGEFQAPAGPWSDGRVRSSLLHLEESAVEAGVIWTGSTDGLVHVTRDGGRTWTNVTSTMPNLPPWGRVTSIQPSRHAKGGAYVTVDRHRADDQAPYVFKTGNYGETWTAIVAGIPKSVLSYARVIREDPTRPGMLYLGTENALYVSFDDGLTWMPLQNNLPHAPVSWLTVQEDFGDLVVATFGRGIWILDDIRPLQQLTPEVLGAPSVLFAPRSAYALERLPPTTRDAMAEEWDPPSDGGRDRPYGVPLNYYLKTASAGDVQVLIQDQQGTTIRTLGGPGGAGLNRVWWNLRPESEEEPEAPPRRQPEPTVTPGVYTVTLVVDGEELVTQVTVLKDPRMEWR